MLHYAVLPFVVGVIKSSPMLTLLATLVLLAGALTLIPMIVNPAAPPYPVALLFRQVRIRLGLPKAMTYIVDIVTTVTKTIRIARVNPNRGAI